MIQINIQRFGGRGASSSGNNGGWNALKRAYKSNLITDGINQIQLYGDKARELRNNIDFGRYNETTQEQLNKEPITTITYINGEPYMQIYENRASLMKSITKEYGGFSQMGDNVSIMNINKEYYLVRDRYAKGGWSWQDANGSDVNGREIKTIRKRV